MRKVKPRFEIPKSVANKVVAPDVGHRARLNLDHVTSRKQYDTTGVKDRHSESRPPPAYEQGFSEFRVSTEAPRAKTTRASRLWTKTEIK